MSEKPKISKQPVEKSKQNMQKCTHQNKIQTAETKKDNVKVRNLFLNIFLCYSTFLNRIDKLKCILKKCFYCFVKL